MNMAVRSTVKSFCEKNPVKGNEKVFVPKFTVARNIMFYGFAPKASVVSQK